MDVFISWSGEQSRQVAEALHRYLPQMINAIEPWLSSTDIEADARWGSDVAGKLEKSKVGIICLTPTNLEAIWIHFEAGALAKTLDNTFVCPYLIGLKPSDVKGPLSQFQAMSADQSGTRRLVETLNRALDKPRRTEDLTDAFTMWWPTVRATLEMITKEEPPPKKRSTEDMLEELLALARRQARDLPPDESILRRRFDVLESRLQAEFGPSASARMDRLEGDMLDLFVYAEPLKGPLTFSMVQSELTYNAIEEILQRVAKVRLAISKNAPTPRIELTNPQHSSAAPDSTT